jgi:hypothetical protein
MEAIISEVHPNTIMRISLWDGTVCEICVKYFGGLARTHAPNIELEEVEDALRINNGEGQIAGRYPIICDQCIFKINREIKGNDR